MAKKQKVRSPSGGYMMAEMATFKKRKPSKAHPVEKEIKKSGAGKKEGKLIKSILKGR